MIWMAGRNTLLGDDRFAINVIDSRARWVCTRMEIGNEKKKVHLPHKVAGVEIAKSVVLPRSHRKVRKLLIKNPSRRCPPGLIPFVVIPGACAPG